MDLTFNLAPSYRDLKDPTSRQNFEDTPGQIPKLILTLRLIQYTSTLSLAFLTGLALYLISFAAGIAPIPWTGKKSQIQILR